VDSHSVFDNREESESGSLDWLYRTANSLHFRTRAGFVASELLFEEGDCLDLFVLAESERILRNYPFLAEVDVYAVPQADGTAHVVVDTEDEWTTQISIAGSFEDGLHLRSLGVLEENLFGRGVFVSASLRRQDERRELGGEIRTPRLLGTRWDARMKYGTTREGLFREGGLAYPFVGEVGRIAAQAVWSDREDLFGYLIGQGAESEAPVHLLIPFRSEITSGAVAVRLGRPGNLTMFGFGVVRNERHFPEPYAKAEVAQDSKFDDATPAPPELVDEVIGQLTGRTTDRLVFMFGQRNVQFVRRAGLDALRGAQDVRVGFEAAVTLGRSASVLGGLDEAGSDDLYTRLHLFGGAERGPWVLASAATVESRKVSEEEAAGAPWRDTLGKFDAFAYWQPEFAPAHTVLARASGAGGWHTDGPFQLTLGGATGVRGYRPSRLPGAIRSVVTVEDRIAVDWPLTEVMDFGFSVFADAGRMWGGSVPFGVDTGWRSAIGAGIRLGFPEGSRSVIRLDIASAIDGGFRSPVFRMVVGEPLGLAAGFAVRQLDRSFGLPIGTDVLGRPWR
jgi:hypothetical protein